MNNTSKIKISHVLGAFWKAIKPYWGWYAVVLTAVAISNVLQLITPLYYKRFFDVVTNATDRTAVAPSLVSILLVILVVNFGSWLMIRITTFYQNIYQMKSMALMKQQSFNYMIDHSYNFFASNFTGSLTQKVNRFARAFDSLMDRLVWNVVPLSINITGVVIVLWRERPLISIIIVLWVFAFLGFNYIFSRWKLTYDIEMAAADSKATGALSDAITNQNAVQLFARMPEEAETYKVVTDYQARAGYISWNLQGVAAAIQSGLIFIAEFFLFYFCVKYWREGTITIGAFVLIQIYFIGLGGRVWDFTRVIKDLYQGMADSKEMLEILHTPHEIKNIPKAKKIAVTKGLIEFNDVNFAFNATRTVLDHISLKINAGEKIALIGPSGAGKSTFVRLILRLYETSKGNIAIDGQNIQKVTQESLRASIAFVPQDPVLFHRTLMENIRYGRIEATDEEVIKAAELAHCDEFIRDLPLKYETFVGERGIKLSGGERQRVAIARALLKNAPILILDEATSSLDSHSESLIQDALDTLMKGRTTIVIAHRLSTIRKMDRIIVLEDGKVKEEGTHESLLTLPNGTYNKLWTLQAGGFLAGQEENVS